MTVGSTVNIIHASNEEGTVVEFVPAIVHSIANGLALNVLVLVPPSLELGDRIIDNLRATYPLVRVIDPALVFVEGVTPDLILNT